MFAWLRRLFKPDPPWSGEVVEVGPESDDSALTYSEARWYELPAEKQRTIVMFLLRDEHWDELMDQIKPEREADPRGWYIPHHFSWGMAMRNRLRDCLPDAALPTGNWDDYYIAAVHAAMDQWEEEKG